MEKSMREQVIGTWALVSYETQDAAGNTIYPLGKDAKGFIMYNPDGYMSAQLMASGRPAYKSGDLHTGTPEEMAEAAHGYLAYSGPFEVDEEKQELTHHMDVSMNQPGSIKRSRGWRRLKVIMWSFTMLFTQKISLYGKSGETLRIKRIYDKGRSKS